MKKNVFVKLDEYNDVVDIIALIDEKINEARSVIQRIYEIKKEEEETLNIWKTHLDEIERKIKHIKHSLSKPLN